MKTNQNPSKKNYFNQTIDGVGYLNRIEWLTPENGDAYLVATINSVVGPENKTWNTRFDCTVASTAREDLEFIAERMAQTGDANIFVAFRAGDMRLSTFVHKSGNKSGQVGIAARVRLIALGYCAIDGQAITLPSQVAQDGADVPAPGVPAVDVQTTQVMPPPFVHPDAVPPPPPRAVSVLPAVRSAPQSAVRGPTRPAFGARFAK